MEPVKPIDRAILPFDARCKSRLLVTLESGEKAALAVERGRLLRGGDRVLSLIHISEPTRPY